MGRDVFGQIRNQRPGDLAYLDESGQWQVLHIPSASSVLTHAGTVGAKPAWTTKSGLLVAGDLPSHDNTKHDNRTRRVSLPLASAFVTDAHGGVIGSVAHFDFADGAGAVTAYWQGMAIPTDYVSGVVTLNFFCSSDAAANNVFGRPVLITQTVGTTGQASDPAAAAAAFACNATANRPFLMSATSSAAPAAGGVWIPILTMTRNDAADTNTGVLSVWGCYIEYTADS